MTDARNAPANVLAIALRKVAVQEETDINAGIIYEKGFRVSVSRPWEKNGQV